MTVRSTLILIGLLVLSLTAAGCGSQTATPGPDLQQSPLVAFSPLPTATRDPTAAPLPTEPSPTATPVPTSAPTVTPTPSLGSLELVVLHTNDNWGETEPCG